MKLCQFSIALGICTQATTSFKALFYRNYYVIAQKQEFSTLLLLSCIH